MFFSLVDREWYFFVRITVELYLLISIMDMSYYFAYRTSR